MKLSNTATSPSGVATKTDKNNRSVARCVGGEIPALPRRGYKEVSANKPFRFHFANTLLSDAKDFSLLR